MIEILREIFEANPSPEKSTIVLHDICSDCGCETIIEITSTSAGFGLQGGALYKCLPDDYFAICPECFKGDQHGKKYRKKEAQEI